MPCQRGDTAEADAEQEKQPRFWHASEEPGVIIGVLQERQVPGDTIELYREHVPKVSRGRVGPDGNLPRVRRGAGRRWTFGERLTVRRTRRAFDAVNDIEHGKAVVTSNTKPSRSSLRVFG